MRARRWLWVCLVSWVAACDQSPTPVLTCSDLCQEFAGCYLTAHPTFMGSKNALVPCENACYSATDSTRTGLRTCATMDCAAFLACGAAAGLKLQPQPVPDLGVSDGSPDAASADAGMDLAQTD